MKDYDEIIQFANIDIAICDIIEKKKSVYLSFFENFYPFVKENFIQNYDKILDFAEKKNTDFNGEVKNFKTNFYGMNVLVDYAISHNKQGMLDKIRLYCNQYNVFYIYSYIVNRIKQSKEVLK